MWQETCCQGQHTYVHAQQILTEMGQHPRGSRFRRLSQELEAHAAKQRGAIVWQMHAWCACYRLHGPSLMSTVPISAHTKTYYYILHHRFLNCTPGCRLPLMVCIPGLRESNCDGIKRKDCQECRTQRAAFLAIRFAAKDSRESTVAAEEAVARMLGVGEARSRARPDGAAGRTGAQQGNRGGPAGPSEAAHRLHAMYTAEDPPPISCIRHPQVYHQLRSQPVGVKLNKDNSIACLLAYDRDACAHQRATALSIILQSRSSLWEVAVSGRSSRCS